MTYNRQQVINSNPKAYWSNKPLYKMSVKECIEEFCGWQAMQELINHPFNHLPRNKAFLCVLFLSGGRIQEVLNLKKENFKLNVDSQGRPEILVTGMMLEKHYTKLGAKSIGADGKKHFAGTKKVHATRRTFPIKLDEPLAPILLEWIENCEGGYLFKTPCKFSKFGHLTRKWAYKYIRKLNKAISPELKEALGINKPFLIDGEEVIEIVNGKKIIKTLHLWCHWFRSQRASQLVENYSFSVEDLMAYFGWTDRKIASLYTQIGSHALADKMDTDLLKGAR
jgi:integrase